MMKKITTYIILLCCSIGFGLELNLPVWTQYLADNPFVVSPTYAGIGESYRFRANGLTQWVGIKDAPDNQAFYGDFRIAERSGIGISLYNDKNGNTLQKGAKFSFAHHLTLDYKSKQFLSFGISYNINSFRIAIEDFEAIEGSPILDPAITDDRSKTNHNFDIGMLYRYKNAYFSLNANNILTKDIDDFDGAEPGDLLNFQVYSGLVLRNAYNRDIEYEPSVFYQLYWSDKRSSTDINYKTRWYSRDGDYIWVGASYRFLNDQFFKPLNIGPMAGFMKKGFYFGYSYQITINDLSRFNSGTHSITIGIDFFQGSGSCDCVKGKNWRRYM